MFLDLRDIAPSVGATFPGEDRGIDMRRVIGVLGLAVVIAALAGCGVPPGQTSWLVLHETGQQPARAGGQIGAVPPTQVTLATVGVGLALDQVLCATVVVLDDPPPFDMAVLAAEAVYRKEHCVPVPLLGPGEQSTTLTGLLADWDETTQGQLEGKWILISGISQRFAPDGLSSPVYLRSAAFDGSAPMESFCGLQLVTPCA